jgi:hypothetical protein
MKTKRYLLLCLAMLSISAPSLNAVCYDTCEFSCPTGSGPSPDGGRWLGCGGLTCFCKEGPLWTYCTRFRVAICCRYWNSKGVEVDPAYAFGCDVGDWCQL